MTSSKFFGINI